MLAAATSVLFNNLPAASVLAARTPAPAVSADWAESRPEPVRDRVAALAAVAPNGSLSGGGSLDCQSQSPGPCRCYHCRWPPPSLCSPSLAQVSEGPHDLSLVALSSSV